MTHSKHLNIIVLMGGDSPEREVSLATGQAVAEALSLVGHHVEARTLAAVQDVLSMTDLSAADVVFPAFHGGAGEDGRLQAVLDLLGVTSALSGPIASGLAMDKAACKRLMRGAGISTPDWLHISGDQCSGERIMGSQAKVRDQLDLTVLAARAGAELGWPLIAKPNRDGSSVGIRIIENETKFPEAWQDVAAQGQSVLLEKFIPGRELTATIFLGRRLPLIEIEPHEGYYDFANKYTEGACDYLCPAPVHSPIYERISDDAQRLFDLIGCRGVARVDFRLDGDTYSCLEINTIPGMTALSLVPKAAAAVGISFPDLLSDLCYDAVCRSQS